MSVNHLLHKGPVALADLGLRLRMGKGWQGVRLTRMG